MATVFARAEQLTTLQRQLDGVLPAEMIGACHVISHDAGTLRLLVHSPAHAAHLRWQQRSLLTTLARAAAPGSPTARKLTIVVRPSGVRQKTRRAPTRRPRSVPALAREDLAQLARAEGDPALRAALERLASRRGADSDEHQ